MKILGLEITKSNNLPTPKDVGLIDLVDEISTLCNNQLRGVTNDKAKEYNHETIEYYVGLSIQKGIEAGISYEQQSRINTQAQDDN